MAQKIYTKAGDKGMTYLPNQGKVHKNHYQIEAIGNVDELNAYIGLLAELLPKTVFLPVLAVDIQSRLFDIGALLACDNKQKTAAIQLPVLLPEDCAIVEKEIDHMQALLEPLTHFILPAGDAVLVQVHIARAVCRRAERSIVAVQRDTAMIDCSMILQYMNRLSDFLFVLARFYAREMNIQEVPWHAKR